MCVVLFLRVRSGHPEPRLREPESLTPEAEEKKSQPWTSPIGVHRLKRLIRGTEVLPQLGRYSKPLPL